ncbi:hypothetical protein IL992_43350 [Microbispora sp. NEAU-D428]|uniref:hypothetical protein n=1 Tax=Microbispora sitophila TaxID=2771537 RepID=UPI001865C333|nr:hypothetical protein [Microbispora sitophila]MBE3015948.1 hypothetical protein [Microbispora sitophila]
MIHLMGLSAAQGPYRYLPDRPLPRPVGTATASFSLLGAQREVGEAFAVRILDASMTERPKPESTTASISCSRSVHRPSSMSTCLGTPRQTRRVPDQELKWFAAYFLDED